MCFPFNKSIIAQYESGMDANTADRTIGVYTNPCKFGTGNMSIAHINIRVNPQTNYSQPGDTTPMSNHAFALILAAGMCHSDVKCWNAFEPKIDLNFMYNPNIRVGDYILSTKFSYPVCCTPTECDETNSK